MKYLLLPFMLIIAGSALPAQPKSNSKPEPKPAVQWAIEPQFKYVNDFSQGTAAVQSGETWGYINTAGAMVIAPRFYEAHPFYEGLAVFAQDSSTYGYIDATGAVVIPARFRSAARFSDGVAFVVGDDGWPCYINRYGQTVLTNRNAAGETVWDYGFEFANGIAPVSSGGSYDAALQMTGGIYFFTTKFNTYPFFTGFYDDALPFSDGLAPVLKGGFWGCINAQGKVVVEHKFEEIRGYAGGYTVASLKSGDAVRWAILDAKGTIALELPRDREPWGGVHEGTVAIKVPGGKTGVVNLKGEWIVEPLFADISAFHEGLAAASLDGQTYGFIRVPVKK
ncbi:MAG: WG repeat-containing protein [Spirochaetes bacterium]|nr:MAG: WG repeat-containing protein [Spirochaetota bacterium]